MNLPREVLGTLKKKKNPYLGHRTLTSTIWCISEWEIPANRYMNILRVITSIKRNFTVWFTFSKGKMIH